MRVSAAKPAWGLSVCMHALIRVRYQWKSQYTLTRLHVTLCVCAQCVFVVRFQMIRVSSLSSVHCMLQVHSGDLLVSLNSNSVPAILNTLWC
jgi:hypothetical protein